MWHFPAPHPPICILASIKLYALKASIKSDLSTFYVLTYEWEREEQEKKITGWSTVAYIQHNSNDLKKDDESKKKGLRINTSPSRGIWS